MKPTTHLLLPVVLGWALVWGASAWGADFRITEFLAANQTVLADDDGLFSDWIEIHNAGDVEADLTGWFLTDDPGDRMKWQFPSTNLAGGQYLVVFASGQDRRVGGAPLHANFRLNAEGGYLALIRPDGAVATEFGSATSSYPVQVDDISYGLTLDEAPELKYFPAPTPGADNVGGVTNVKLTPLFSLGTRTFTSSILIELTSPLADAEIRFTTDGTPPSLDAALYTEPLTITNTTRVRAALFFPNEPPGPNASETYLRLSASAQLFRSPLPIVVLENFGAGPVPGVNSRGPNRDGSGVVEVFMQAQSLLIFDRTNGSTTALTSLPVTATRAGLKLRGSSSFAFTKKSYALETWDEQYDTEQNLSLLGMPAESDWVLYSPDFTQFDASLIHNSFLYELANQSGYYASRTRFVEVFLNTTGANLGTEHYAGLFLLMEKVKRGRDRVDFEPLSADGTNGGWMLNVDRMDALPPGSVPDSMTPRHFHTAGPDHILQTEDDNPFGYQGPGGINGLPPPRDDQPDFYFAFLNFESPSGWDINAAQRNRIQSYVRAFDAALYGPNFANPTNGYAAFIDVDNFVHHFILHSFVKNQDAAVLSTFLLRPSATSKLQHGPVWDVDRAYNRNPNDPDPLGQLKWASDRLFYTRLFADLNFNQAYIDKWQELRRGAFATSNLLAIVDAQTNQITSAVAARHGLPAFSWAANVGSMRSWLVARANAIDAQFPASPVFSHPGGAVPNGLQLVMVSPGVGTGTIYYTTDGTDPRVLGGGVSAAAQAFVLPLTVNGPTTLIARTRNGGAWSGPTRATYFPPQDLSSLRLTEVMYHAPDLMVGPGLVSGDELDFLELKNTGSAALDLSGLEFTSGITFAFPVGTMLDAGAFFVLGRNPAMLQVKYPGLTVQGVFGKGKLDNGGEPIRLSYPGGAALWSVTYDDVAPWPVPADGYGFSIVPRELTGSGDPGTAAQWRASTNPGGSPGADDPDSPIPTVLVNEVMTASISPALDAIELFNPTTAAVDLAGWFLSDDSSTPRKFRIPDGTLIEPGSFLVFDESQFNAIAGGDGSFALSSMGDEVYLFSGDATTNLTGYSHGFSFDGAEAGVSFGRVVTSIGEERFVAQRSSTFGLTNSSPRIGPIVLSEIHYHPDAEDDEFVELRNVTTEPVPLFDEDVPENCWRLNGLNFVLPSMITLEPGQTLLLVATNPALFRAKYNLPDQVLVLGPYAGVLQDSGERLELQRLYQLGTNTYYVTVDAVRYNDRAPWPPAADGSGFSLQRRDLNAFGDDPANWAAAPPTPGEDLPPGLAPVFLLQPESQRVVLGQTTEFIVSAGGSEPLFYQWLFNGAPIAGAGSTNLVLTSAQAPDAGNYSVLVYNETGSVISSNATLIVAMPPVIINQPRHVALRGSTNALTYGQTFSNVTFTVLATGLAPVTYQWRLDGDEILGAVAASLTLTNATLAHEGSYDVLVTDAVGSTRSSNAVLTILLTPTLTNVPPPNQLVLAGTNLTWEVAAVGNPLPYTFDWRRLTTLLATRTVDSRADAFTLTAAQPSHSGSYSVTVRNAAAPNGVTANFSLTVLVPAADNDGDGMLNQHELLAGTDPLDRANYLKVNRVRPGFDLATIEFSAVSNRTYTVQFTDALPSGWQRLTNVLAGPSNRMETVFDPSPASNRFYRLLTPAAP